MLRQVIYALEKQNVRGIRRLQARLKKRRSLLRKPGAVGAGHALLLPGREKAE